MLTLLERRRRDSSSVIEVFNFFDGSDVPEVDVGVGDRLLRFVADVGVFSSSTEDALLSRVGGLFSVTGFSHFSGAGSFLGLISAGDLFSTFSVLFEEPSLATVNAADGLEIFFVGDLVLVDSADAEASDSFRGNEPSTFLGVDERPFLLLVSSALLSTRPVDVFCSTFSISFVVDEDFSTEDRPRFLPTS